MTEPKTETLYVVIQGERRLTVGTLGDVAVAARRTTDTHPNKPLIVLNRTTGKVIDLDLRGDDSDIRARYTSAAAETGKRGRPKLGVIAREITLLPRHWDWLAQQPGGASVTLRKFIDAARKDGPDLKARINAAYNIMFALAGDRAGFEEASRALFAGDRDALTERIASWPSDIRSEILGSLGTDSFVS